MMKTLRKLSQTIGCTPAEGRVALFLAATFLLGIGIKLYRGAADPASAFDYAALDAEFALLVDAGARSDSLAAARKAGMADSARSERPARAGKKEVPRGSIEINAALKSDFMRLPGIGETTAERIIEYRSVHGPFTTLEELMNVKGIGKKKFERIAPSCIIRK